MTDIDPESETDARPTVHCTRCGASMLIDRLDSKGDRLCPACASLPQQWSRLALSLVCILAALLIIGVLLQVLFKH